MPSGDARDSYTAGGLTAPLCDLLDHPRPAPVTEVLELLWAARLTHRMSDGLRPGDAGSHPGPWSCGMIRAVLSGRRDGLESRCVQQWHQFRIPSLHEPAARASQLYAFALAAKMP